MYQLMDNPKKIKNIEELALVLNVSKSTISRAFRDSYDISPKTKKMILEAASKYGFHPNSTAQSLRENKTKRIGVIVPSFTIPFYSNAICGIQEVARKEGYNLLICESDESYEIELENIRSLVKSRVDGIIMSITSETNQYKHIKDLRDSNFPLVLFNRTTDLPGISKIRIDDYDGTFKMTMHLLSKGYKDIVYLAGPKNLMMTKRRVKGYLDAMYINHIIINPDNISYGDFSIEHGQDIAARFLSDNIHPEVFFCSCDNVAYGVIKYLKSVNIRIPDEIAVAGFTDELYAELIEPSLTTIHQPVREIGIEAAKLLFKQLKYKNTRPEILELPTTLVIRTST